MFYKLSKIFILQWALFYWSSGALGISSPKITVDGYALADSFDTWNTNFTFSDLPLGIKSNLSTFVVPSAIRGFSLMCNATFPVEWTFHREKWNQRTNWQTSLQNTRGSDPGTLDPLWFSSELRFLGHNNEITGNYTCQKYGQPRISSSVYVFWEGTSPPYLTLLQSGTQRRTIRFDNKNYKSFIVPCTVSRPDITVVLTKIKNDNSTVDITKNVTYDAAVGFTVSNIEDPFGIYACVVGEVDDDDSLEFDVKQATGTDPVVQEFEDSIWGTASFSYDSSKRQFVCCSSTSKPPKIGHYYCYHPCTCKLQKHALHKIETASRRTTQENCAILPLRALTAGVLRCKGDSIDIVREYFFPMMQQSQRFRRNNNYTVIPYFSWDEADPEKMMMLTNLTGSFYVGEKKRFICRASRFYFAQGIHWMVTYENSTIYVQGNQTQFGKKHPFGIFQQGNYATMELTADIGLKSLTCKAPIWNTTGWGQKTLSFTIKTPTAPTIEGGSEEDKTFSSNSQKILVCKFSGVPNPKVLWKKNGRIIHGSSINITETSSTINITSRATSSSQAAYMCNVTNAGGFATKIFHVYISDGLSGLKISFYVGGLIMFIAAIIGGGFAVKKMRSQKKAIQHLANVAFKDVNDVATQQSTSAPITNGNTTNNGNVVHPFGQNESFQSPNTASDFGRYEKM